MNYIERVLPSLGRGRGHPALDRSGRLRRRRTQRANGSTGDRGRDQGQPADGGVLKRLVAAGRRGRTVPRTASSLWRATCSAWTRPSLARVSAEVLAHHKVNRAAKPPRRRCWPRSGGPGPDEPGPGPGRVRRAGDRHGRIRACSSTPGGRPSAPTDALARLADHDVLRRVAVGLLPTPMQQLTQRQYRVRRGADWTVADAALLDELAAPAGPVPAGGAGGVACSWSPTARSPSWSPPWNGSPRSGRTTRSRPSPRHVRARAGGRGPGHHPDAVADAAPPGTERQLDHRRRSGAEVLARPGGVRSGAWPS